MVDQPNSIDESLYSRQLYVLGHDAMKKMQQESIIISSCEGLSVEIAKNIILSGVQKVVVMDNEVVTHRYYSTNFFLEEEAQAVKSKTKRLSATIKPLSELNPHTKVVPEYQTFSSLLLKKPVKLKEIISSYSVRTIVLVNEKQSTVFAAGDFARANGLRLIVANSFGFFGYVACDFGPSHIVTKKNDMELPEGIIGQLTISSTEGKKLANVSLVDESMHNLVEGDTIQFSELSEPFNKVLEGQVKVAKVNNPYSFSVEVRDIEGVAEEGSSSSGGKLKFVELPKEFKMETLASVFENETHSKMSLFDFNKFDRQEFYLELLKALDKNKEPVKPHKQKYTEKILKQMDPKYSDPDLKYPEVLIRASSLSVAAINSVIGGVASQEIIKAVSGRFTPIDQVLFFDFSELGNSKVFSEKKENLCYRPNDDRDFDLVGLFGKEWVSKVNEQKGLMVGSGAIGCELLKNFTMMGMFCNEGGLLVIDNDKIERSNLNRQFLFRENDIGHFKATVACKKVKGMQPKIGAQAENCFFGADYKNLGSLIRSKTLLFSALDNLEARLFLDSQALFYNRPLFDSGTLGCQGNSQPIIPGMTESYGASRDPEEKQIPACTLKHYPYKPEHVVHWARDLFAGEFESQPASLNIVKEKEGKASEIESDSAARFLKFTLGSIELSSFEKLSYKKKLSVIAKASADLFLSLFTNNIKQLLKNFPKDAKNSSGNPFWSGTKRCPSPIELNLTSFEVREFIESSVFLKCSLMGIKTPNFQEHSIDNLLSEFEMSEFKPADDVDIPENDNAEVKDSLMILTPEQKQEIIGLTNRIRLLEFEKDDDKNGHIRFISSAARLRAKNYTINGDFSNHNIKKIAGKIIPAVATTTSIVSGLVVIEALKYLKDCKLDHYKSFFVNLSVPLFAAATPIEPKMVKIKVNEEGVKFLGKRTEDLKEGSVEISPWDKIVLPYARNRSGLELTIGEIESLVSGCEWKLGMITYGSYCVISPFMGDEKLAEIKEKTLVEVLMEDGIIKEEPAKGELMSCEIFVEDKDGEDIELPSLVIRI